MVVGGGGGDHLFRLRGFGGGRGGHRFGNAGLGRRGGGLASANTVGRKDAWQRRMSHAIQQRCRLDATAAWDRRRMTGT